MYPKTIFFSDEKSQQILSQFSVNDYKLQWFKIGDDIFHYRLSTWYETIQEGENTYKIYAEKDKEKELLEEIIYIYNTDIAELKKIEEEYFKKEEKEISEPEIEEIGTRSVTIDSFSLENLDERFYYTLQWEALKIQLVYVNSDKTIETTAQSIKDQLENTGIFVELIPLSLSKITRWLRDESLSYDAILIGVNLWYFDSNIFPYFHSSQVKNGYNFSNLKQLGLDILLEELKSNNLTNTKKEELEIKILNILKKSSAIKILYSPKIHLLVDKNLEWFNLDTFIPDDIHRFDPLIKTYLTKKKIIMTESKGFIDFWKFVFNSFL